MISPELRTSEKVAQWPREVRYFWVLLLGYLDDYGKGKDNPQLIKSDCLPLDDDVTASKVDEWLWIIAGAGVIVRYTADGVKYIGAVNWREHQTIQHPTNSKIPDQEGNEIRVKGSRKIRESLTPSLVKSNSIEASRGRVTDSDFLVAWTHWPKKTDRTKSFERFAAIAKSRGLETITAEVIKFGDAYARTTEKKFVPALAAWLNRERWTDELPTAGGAAPAYVPEAKAPAGKKWAVDVMDDF